jgi:hypothetical protein
MLLGAKDDWGLESLGDLKYTLPIFIFWTLLKEDLNWLLGEASTVATWLIEFRLEIFGNPWRLGPGVPNAPSAPVNNFFYWKAEPEALLA